VTGVDAQASSAAAEASIARNTVLAFAAQLATGTFTAVLTLYLLRALGPSEYGVFALAVSIGVMAGLLADFGIEHSAARFLAERRGDEAVVAELLRVALRMKVATTALVTAVLFGLAGPLAAAFDEPDLTWPLRVTAVAVFGESIFMLYVTAFIGLARIGMNLRLIVLESSIETGASIALVALGAGAVGAAFGRAAGYVFGALVAVAVVARLYGGTSVRLLGRDARYTRAIARYAAPLLVTTSIYTVFSRVDILIIGALLGTTAVGVFSAPLLLSVPLRYVGQAVANSVSPRQAGGGNEPGSVEAFRTSLRWVVVYQAVLLAPLIVWAGPIVDLLFGAEYGESADVLRALSIYIFLAGPSPLISTTVNYLGQAARRIPIVLLALGVNVAVDLALIPRIGVIGAAIGSSAAYALYVPAHLRICRRELGVPLRPLALTLARALAAAGAMGLVLLAVGTESLSPVQWVLGGTAGTLAFCAALVLTGEISKSELRRGLRAARALVRKTGIRRRGFRSREDP
jgi:O-antigen/teichoic acid export membrane protein